MTGLAPEEINDTFVTCPKGLKIPPYEEEEMSTPPPTPPPTGAPGATGPQGPQVRPEVLVRQTGSRSLLLQQQS